MADEVFLAFSVTDFKSDVTVPVEDNMEEFASQEPRVIDGYTKIESKIFCKQNIAYSYAAIGVLYLIIPTWTGKGGVFQ